MQKSRSSADPTYTHDHEPPLFGFSSTRCWNTSLTPQSPIFHTSEEELKLLGEALIPWGFKWPKSWGEHKTNNLLIDTKTEPNPQTLRTNQLMEILGEHNKIALKKSIESASKKMRKDDLKEVPLSGAGTGYTLIRLGVGGHGGSHTFCETNQTN